MRYIAQIVRLPRSANGRYSSILCYGLFAINSSFTDVWVMIAFGVIGIGLEYCRVPLGPRYWFCTVPIAEEQLRHL